MNPQLALLLLIAAETSYLAFRTLRAMPHAKKKDKIICDTSALIDGRIVSICRSGFVASQIIIPRSVVRELQYMADKADHIKRERARYGLDIVQELQQMSGIEATIYDDGTTVTDVDEQLIQLAKKLQAKLCTTDYNLNKVARTEQVTVVNVNELAHALRPMHLPGEQIQVPIVARGQNKDQGIGYLDDGSMVVVDNGLSSIDKTVLVETTRVLQTEAGRMVFAKLVSSPAQPKKPFVKKPRVSPKHAKTHRDPEDSLVRLANR